MRRSDSKFTYPLLAAFALFSFHTHAIAADLGRSVIPPLQERFGMSEAQVRGSLGALLISRRSSRPRSLNFSGRLASSRSEASCFA